MSTHKENYLLQIRKAIPTDVVVGVGTAVTIALLVLLVQMNTLVQTVVALPLLVFLPGYFVLAVLFPRAAHAGRADTTQLDQFERFVLSYGVSLAVLPLLALGLTALSLPLTVEDVLLAVTVLVVGCAPLAVVRRAGVPEKQRYEFSRPALTDSVRDRVDEDQPVDLAINIALAITVVVGLAVTMAVILAPPQETGYTEVAVLTENGQGDLVASGYDDAIGPNGSEPLVLSVKNHHDERRTYSVAVQTQRVTDDGTVQQRERLRQFEREVPANGTWQEPHQIDPSMTGENVRVVYLVYQETLPDDPTRAGADKSVFIWVDS